MAATLSRVEAVSNGKGFAFTLADLKGRGLVAFGDTLKGLVHVTSLDASKNKLTDAAALATLPSLQEATIENNDITSLPTVEGLVRFQVLVASNNLIDTLAGFSSPSLIHLGVSGET